MGVEVLIYCYGIICLCMIAFNCVCIFSFRNRDRRIKRCSRSLDYHIQRQTDILSKGEEPDDKEYRYLNRKLSKIGNLMAFNMSVDKLMSRDSKLAERYLEAIRPVILYLATVYINKESIQSVYFLHILEKYKINNHLTVDSITELVMQYLKKPNLYCRVKAMKFLYKSKSENDVVKGVLILEDEKVYFNQKLLTNGFMSFEGDHSRLIAALLSEFDCLHSETQTAVLEYIRLKSGCCCQQMFNFLCNEEYDDEVRYSALRYFGRYYYEPAKNVLLAFLSDADDEKQIYASISAQALAIYPGKDTIQALKDAVSSSDWYVRYNAAQSLEALGVTYNDLADIVYGSDRYAREMITYCSEHKNLTLEAI
ncbi:MAG: HEAT repeat domain-containing protein [Clostridiales bacterium]|nr:HEAT repeat domain-containing protein [Clostridiales bacterium]